MNPKDSTDFSVIILAAGNGSRMQSKVRKQFLELQGKKILSYSIESFLSLSNNIIVVLPSLEDKQGLPVDVSLKYVVGGNTRTESIIRGLDHVSTPYVLIHDAARPFVTEYIVQEVLRQLSNYACAYPVMPVVNSIVMDKNDELVATPDRSVWREVQTPQGFQTEWLKKALEHRADEHAHIPEIIRRMGQQVKHVQGSPWLFKITYAPSLYAAEHYIKTQGKENERN